MANQQENKSSVSRLELRIHGMDCAEEVTLLKRELVPLLRDEDRLGFDLLNGKLAVDMSSLDVTRGDLLAAIERTGLKAEPWRDDGTVSDDQLFWQQHQRSILTAVSGLFGLAGLMLQLSAAAGTHSVPLMSIALYSVGIVAGLFLVLSKAWRSLVSLRPGMNLLMSVAVIGAVLIGEWFEGATVAFLFSVSLLLESWSVGRARRAIASLMDLSPPTAHLRS